MTVWGVSGLLTPYGILLDRGIESAVWFLIDLLLFFETGLPSRPPPISAAELRRDSDELLS
jgi:hypothetical protein